MLFNNNSKNLFDLYITFMRTAAVCERTQPDAKITVVEILQKEENFGPQTTDLACSYPPRVFLVCLGIFIKQGKCYSKEDIASALYADDVDDEDAELLVSCAIACGLGRSFCWLV